MNEKELQLVLEEGEGYKKPFFQKESFTKEILYFMYNKIKFKESLASIDKEMVAFANSSGGRIFLGITDDKKSVLRNPNIAGLLHRVKYIEKMGTGINKMRGLIAEAGLPPIVFEFGTFFTAIFRRPEVREAAELETRVEGMFSEKYIENFSVNFSVNFGVKGKQLKRMVSIIIRAAQGKDLKIPELADEFDVTTRTLYEDMKKLQNWGIFKFVGAPKTGRYVLTEQGKKILEGVWE